MAYIQSTYRKIIVCLVFLLPSLMWGQTGTQPRHIEAVDTVSTGEELPSYEDFIIVSRLDTIGKDDYRYHHRRLTPLHLFTKGDSVCFKLTVDSDTSCVKIDTIQSADTRLCAANYGSDTLTLFVCAGANVIDSVKVEIVGGGGGGTDDQQVTNFSISGHEITLEIEDDGQPPQTLNVPDTVAPPQQLSIVSNGSIDTIFLSEDGFVVLDHASGDTDSQNIFLSMAEPYIWLSRSKDSIHLTFPWVYSFDSTHAQLGGPTNELLGGIFREGWVMIGENDRRNSSWLTVSIPQSNQNVAVATFHTDSADSYPFIRIENDTIKWDIGNTDLTHRFQIEGETRDSSRVFFEIDTNGQMIFTEYLDSFFYDPSIDVSNRPLVVGSSGRVWKATYEELADSLSIVVSADSLGTTHQVNQVLRGNGSRGSLSDSLFTWDGSQLIVGSSMPSNQNSTVDVYISGGAGTIEAVFNSESANPDFVFQKDGESKAQIGYNGDLFFRTNDSNTGNAGISGNNRLLIDGTTGQLQVPDYTTVDPFPQTEIGVLTFDASGNIGGIDISGFGTPTGTANTVAYFDASGNLTSETGFEYNETTNLFYTPGITYLANDVSTGLASLEIGNDRTGTGTALIDLHSTVSSDYDGRVLHTGTHFEVSNNTSGNINIRNGGSLRGQILNTGQWSFSSYTTSGAFPIAEIGLIGHSNTGELGSLPVSDYENPSFTQGNVVYGGGAGNALKAETNMFWDETNNRFGLGDATPEYTLDVNGTAQITGSSGTSVSMMGRNASGVISGISAGSGLTLSSNVLTAVDNSTSNELQTIGQSGTSITLTSGGSTNINEMVEDIVGGMVSGNSESGITVTYQDSDGTLDFTVTGGSADGDGIYDGSGTIGSSAVSTTSGNGWTIDVSTGDFLTMDYSNDGVANFLLQSTGIWLRANGSEEVRIGNENNSAREIEIDADGFAAWVVLEGFAGGSSVNRSGLTFETDGDVVLGADAGSSDDLTLRADGNISFVAGSNMSTTGNLALNAAPSGTYALYVNGSQFSTSATTFTTSDRTTKEEIEPVLNPYGRLRALNPVTFYFNEEQRAITKQPRKLMKGFIAQEYSEVFPEDISTGPDGKLAIDQGAVLPYTVAAVKQLINDQESLKKRVEALEAILFPASLQTLPQSDREQAIYHYKELGKYLKK